jgi:hypothetical protein
MEAWDEYFGREVIFSVKRMFSAHRGEKIRDSRNKPECMRHEWQNARPHHIA